LHRVSGVAWRSGSTQSHFKDHQTSKQLTEPLGKPDTSYLLPHPIWSDYEVNSLDTKMHHKPTDISDRLAYITVTLLKHGFDLFSGFKFGKPSAQKWVNRIIFLETVAGVPGMVFGMLRHLRSLRSMKRDYGWIHTLLEEAENERMHLMTAMQLKQPGPLFRLYVIAAQGVYVNAFFVAYLVSPKFCHRLVGYLEETAVATYTKLLKQMDEGELPEWKDTLAPEIAKSYWCLGEKATLRDVVLAIRADEAHHRDVNHNFASMPPDQANPVKPYHHPAKEGEKPEK
jgi:hypothetical protein